MVEQVLSRQVAGSASVPEGGVQVPGGRRRFGFDERCEQMHGAERSGVRERRIREVLLSGRDAEDLDKAIRSVSVPGVLNQWIRNSGAFDAV